MISIRVTFPNTRKSRWFRSINKVAKMLSGNGTASGGLRSNINAKALNGVLGLPKRATTVRNNRLYG